MIKFMDELRQRYESEIAAVLLDGFEKELLQAAFDNLGFDSPLKLNNFAYAIRELLRHLLYRLAPNDDLEECIWFEPDKTSTTGITRNHRIKYAVQGGLSDKYVVKVLGFDEVEKVSCDLVQIISSLSKYTHIEHGTFNLSEPAVTQKVTECLDVTIKFIELIDATRLEVISLINIGQIDQALLDRILFESVDEIESLSSRQSIISICADTINVKKIGPKSLTIQAIGSFECELEYGSSSDMRSGDGYTTSEVFPFEADIDVRFVKPLGKDMSVVKVLVDTEGY